MERARSSRRLSFTLRGGEPFLIARRAHRLSANHRPHPRRKVPRSCGLLRAPCLRRAASTPAGTTFARVRLSASARGIVSASGTANLRHPSQEFISTYAAATITCRRCACRRADSDSAPSSFRAHAHHPCRPRSPQAAAPTSLGFTSSTYLTSPSSSSNPHRPG